MEGRVDSGGAFLPLQQASAPKKRAMEGSVRAQTPGAPVRARKRP